MLRKSTITLYLAIGLIISLIVSKQVQHSLLNRINVVSAIGIDKSKRGYIASIQIYNPSSIAKDGSGEQSAYTFSAQGKTIPEAIDRIHEKLGREIYLDNTEVVVIGESFVKTEEISSLTQYFMRESNLPANIRFVISKGAKVDKLLQIVVPIQKVSGSKLAEMLNRKRESWGKLPNITSNKIKEMLNKNRTELTIPYITIKGLTSKATSKENIEKSSPNASLAIEGFAVFKNQRFSYWLSSRESNLLALTRSKIHDITLVTKCRKQPGYVTWKDVRSKPVIRLLYNKGGPSFLLQLQMKGKLSDVSCKMDTSTVQAIAALEHNAEHDLQIKINQLITKTQNKKTDIEGFGEVLYRKQPDRWNRIKNNWDTAYSTVQIRTKVTFDLIDVGDISSSLK